MEHKISIKTVNGILSLDEFKTRVIAKSDVVGVILQTEVIGIIISLDQWEEQWCSKDKIKIFNEYCNHSETLQIMRGSELTQNIVAQNEEDKEAMTAAMRCWRYKKGGLKWYLPSVYELSTISAYCSELNKVLEAMNRESFNPDDWYWSSCEGYDSCEERDNCNKAWIMYLPDGDFSSGDKTCLHAVRAVSAYHPLQTEANTYPTPITIESAISFLKSQGYTGELTKKIYI